jgi:hypothetical protein
MNKKTIMWVGIYSVSAFAIYLGVKKIQLTIKEKKILELYKVKYKGLEEAYLKAWAKASASNKTEFTYNGKVYLSKTGKAKMGIGVTPPPKKSNSNIPSNPFGDSNIN